MLCIPRVVDVDPGGGDAYMHTQWYLLLKLQFFNWIELEHCFQTTHAVHTTSCRRGTQGEGGRMLAYSMIFTPKIVKFELNKVGTPFSNHASRAFHRRSTKNPGGPGFGSRNRVELLAVGWLPPYFRTRLFHVTIFTPVYQAPPTIDATISIL